MIDALQKALLEEGEGAFRQFYLNQFAKYGSRTFVPLLAWDKCAETPDYATLPSRNCYVGIDLSSTTDLTAAALLFEPQTADGKWDALVWCWIAGESLLDVCRRDKCPYDKWMANGNLIFEGRPVIDVSSVKAKLLELKQRYRIQHVGFDPHLADSLKGWEPDFVVTPVPQQVNFISPPTKRLREKIMKGQLRHGGDPLLRSMVENSRVDEDVNGNIRLDKRKYTSRIDALAALVNAEFIAVKHPEPQGSIFEHGRDGGVMSIAEMKERMAF
jgi:phage terminase large subunit-like protein